MCIVSVPLFAGYRIRLTVPNKILNYTRGRTLTVSRKINPREELLSAMNKHVRPMYRRPRLYPDSNTDTPTVVAFLRLNHMKGHLP